MVLGAEAVKQVIYNLHLLSSPEPLLAPPELLWLLRVEKESILCGECPRLTLLFCSKSSTSTKNDIEFRKRMELCFLACSLLELSLIMTSSRCERSLSHTATAIDAAFFLSTIFSAEAPQSISTEVLALADTY